MSDAVREPLIRLARKIVQGAAWFEESLLAFLLAAMTGVAFANVVARRVFASSFPWALELTLNLFLYLVLLGMAYAFRLGLHASVDALTARLAVRARKLCALFAGLFVVLYALVLSATGFHIAKLFWTNEALRGIGSEEIGIPHWFTYSLLSFSFAYLALTALAITLGTLWRGGSDSHPKGEHLYTKDGAKGGVRDDLKPDEHV